MSALARRGLVSASRAPPPRALAAVSSVRRPRPEGSARLNPSHAIASVAASRSRMCHGRRRRPRSKPRGLHHRGLEPEPGLRRRARRGHDGDGADQGGLQGLCDVLLELRRVQLRRAESVRRARRMHARVRLAAVRGDRQALRRPQRGPLQAAVRLLVGPRGGQHLVEQQQQQQQQQWRSGRAPRSNVGESDPVRKPERFADGPRSRHAWRAPVSERDPRRACPDGCRERSGHAGRRRLWRCAERRKRCGHGHAATGATAAEPRRGWWGAAAAAAARVNGATPRA